MIDLPLVLMTHTLPAEWIASLQGRCRILTGPVDATNFDPGLLKFLPEAHGLFTLLTIPVREQDVFLGAKLRVVSNMAAGVDNIDVQKCTKHKIPVGNTPGVLTEGTADLTMALLLAAARGLSQASLDAREGRWKTWSPTGWLGADLYGSTLGIIGMGKIGNAVAQRASSFGMRIIFYDPNAQTHPKAEKVTLEEVIRQSDFITIHVPLTKDTYQMIGIDTLGKMKHNAILINASRGPIVDTMALFKTLRGNRIAAAALDVTDPEPLPPDHPLYSLPNCLIVPHIGSATWNTRRRMAELACDNLLAGLEGRRLPNCVNPEVYD